MREQGQPTESVANAFALSRELVERQPLSESLKNWQIALIQSADL
jgi:hypothetical protein